MAHFVGLDPGNQLYDAGSFRVLYRARLPTTLATLFKDIVKDIGIAMKQREPPINQDNEETKSRFLAPVSICALFCDPILISSSCSSSTEP